MPPSRVKISWKLLIKLCLFVCLSTSGFGQSNEWDKLPEILSSIKLPVFSAAVYNVIDYGARGDSSTDCSEAINKAIRECSAAGGGEVIVPNGIYITGPITLLSGVNLHLEDGAVLRFLTQSDKYLPVVYTRWEGVECMSYSALIYAYGQSNIGLTGKGTLDAQGSNANWWSWCGKAQYGWKDGLPEQKPARKRLMDMAKANLPVSARVFGAGSFLRPNFVQFYNCKNILIESLTLKNSPMWFFHPVMSENITARDLRIEGLGPNNDGFDPESCKNVLIENCFFNTGDDCIAIKSGRNEDGRRINVPSENIVVRNCTMNEGHGGVVLGSEISGGVKNVYAEKCLMDSPNLERALRFKTNSVRGGYIQNFFARDITVNQVSDAAVKLDLYYEEGDAGNFPPAVENIRIRNLVCKKSPFAVWMKAYERAPVKDLLLENCRFENIQKNNVLENVSDPKFINVIINNKLVE